MPNLQLPPAGLITGDENQIPGKSIGANISVYDDPHAQKSNQPCIVDLITLERLTFQTIPGSIDYDSASVFAALESPGRNNPLYHYTGGEDIIQFKLSWYANHSSREDVIRKCKWLIALTKSDGKLGIHPVKLIFGVMFKSSKYIISAAPFSMKHFDRESGMVPRLAESNLTLRKISDTNTNHLEIKNPEF